jgi:membrane associated rhomboid family serine protease
VLSVLGGEPAQPVVVFRGSRRASAEAGLVLEAKGVAYDSVWLDGEFVLLVAAAAAATAREELTRYALERRVAQRVPEPFVPFSGAGTGAVIFASILLLVAYLNGIQAFGADWLDAGSLDARTGGSGEWWRAVTSLTLHLDQAHLLGNLLFGVGIGALAGRAFGPGVAWASILGAGAAADYLDMLISPPAHRAAGASTAVFAALGLLVGFAWRHGLTLREQFKYRWGPLFAGLCLLALLGAGDEHVDVLGHALGFGSGTALGWIYSRMRVPRSRSARLQIGAGGAALALIVLAWFLALHRWGS